MEENGRLSRVPAIALVSTICMTRSEDVIIFCSYAEVTYVITPTIKYIMWMLLGEPDPTQRFRPDRRPEIKMLTSYGATVHILGAASPSGVTNLGEGYL